MEVRGGGQLWRSEVEVMLWRSEVEASCGGQRWSSIVVSGVHFGSFNDEEFEGRLISAIKSILIFYFEGGAIPIISLADGACCLNLQIHACLWLQC